MILNLFSGSIASAQIRIGAAPKPKPKPIPVCNGAWTGAITYSRFQEIKNNKTVDRVSARGQDTTNFELNYDYKANVAVMEAPEKNGQSRGLATMTSRLKSTEKVTANERNSCDRGKTWQTMSGTSLSITQTVGEGRDDANVNVGINTDGTYTVSVGLPQIKGMTGGSQSTTYSGQCTTKEGKTFTMPNAPTTVDGNSLTSDGTNRINPEDPYNISGSYTKTWQGVTETIKWNLRKCGGPLRITELKFEHPKFPDFTNWVEIDKIGGTVDGNMVKIKAKVLNASGDTRSAKIKMAEVHDQWNVKVPDENIGDGEMDVTLDPGEEKEVEMIWDSEGYAWFNDGRPRFNDHKIKAELIENGKKVDDKTEQLRIAPKPLVLVHGAWDDYRVWEPLYQNILTTTKGYEWKAYAVGDKVGEGTMLMGADGGHSASVYNNADQLTKYVKYAQTDRNAWHVDMVAHQMGGLVGRLYIHKSLPSPDGRPLVKNFVMLGTPNNGAPCVDVFLGKLGMLKDDLNAARELTSEEMQRFNQFVKNTNGTKFSALAGNPVPVICGGYEWNDSFITVKSAIHGVPDYAYTNDISRNMLDGRNFGNFVLPHLVSGPDGKYPLKVKSDKTGIDRFEFDKLVDKVLTGSIDSGKGGFYATYERAAYERQPQADMLEDNPQTFRHELKLAARQSTVIDVPVEAAQNFGVTFMAKPGLSVSLIDDRGTVVSKSTKDSPLAEFLFRMVYVRMAIKKGVWKLKIENTSDTELSFAGFGWSAKQLPANLPVAE